MSGVMFILSLNLPFVLSAENNYHFLVKVASVPGIMARDSKTVVTVTKLLLNDNHLQIHGDPDLLPIPWNEKVFFFRNTWDNLTEQFFLMNFVKDVFRKKKA